MRRVFLRNMVADGRIGVLAHEQGRTQRVRINVDLQVDEEGAGGPARDELPLVVDYARLADAVRAVLAAGHVKLLETLAERIAEAAFFDARVRAVRVRVEKLDIFADMEAVGIEIERGRGPGSTILSTAPD